MDEELFPASSQLPPALSTWAAETDWLYYFIFWVSVVFFVGIVGAMLYFMVRYRRRPGVKAEPTGHHNALELFWTFSPLILLFMMFHWGYQHYLDGAIAPDDAMNIRVRGQRWAWSFEHPNGREEHNEVHVPVGRAVRFIISSEDVLHSFFIPDFRVKRDAVPGMFTSLWFEALDRPDLEEHLAATTDITVPSETRELYRTQVYCAEYCGAGGAWGPNAGHATMLAEVAVMREEDYEEFLRVIPVPMCPDGAGGERECTEPEWGEQLFAQRGCMACHQRNSAEDNLQGPNMYGPFWGREEHLSDGSTVTIDAEYVSHSIERPRDQVVAGFEPIMPTIRMTDAERAALVAYLGTL